MSYTRNLKRFGQLSRLNLSSEPKIPGNPVHSDMKPKPSKKFQKRNDKSYNNIESIAKVFPDSQIEQVKFDLELMKQLLTLDCDYNKKFGYFHITTLEDESLLYLEFHKLDDNLWYVSKFHCLDLDTMCYLHIQEDERVDDFLPTLRHVMSKLFNVYDIVIDMANIIKCQEVRNQKLRHLKRLRMITHVFKYLNRSDTCPDSTQAYYLESKQSWRII